MDIPMNEVNTMASDGVEQNTLPAADYEHNIRQTIKYGNKIQVCRAIFRDFFTDCSIQGFKYFCERKRHWSERVFWMIMFAIATCLSCVMIQNSYTKWDETPVIVSLSEKSKPVWKIPFPAVTICPDVKASRSKINLTEVHHFLSKTMELRKTESESEICVGFLPKKKVERLEALLQVCGAIREPEKFGALCLPFMTLKKDIINASVIHTLNDLSIKMDGDDEAMLGCKWQNKDCSNFFRPILTEDGFCYTFNSLNSRDIYTDEVAPELFSVSGNPNASYWNLEKGYNKTVYEESSHEFYPRRILGTGPFNGLTTLLKLNSEDIDYLCQGPVQGFKVILHTPGEIPRPSKNFFSIPLEQQILISVKPNMIETSKELEDYSFKQKHCFLNSERKLRFFKAYTQRHCELECISNRTEKECGCVYFAYPRHKDSKICGIPKFKCLNEIEEKMSNDEYLYGDDSYCNCLPACTSMTYDVEISQAKFDFPKHVQAFAPPGSDVSIYSNGSISNLNIYFKESEIITSKRSELYGLTQLLAACGGILGLFIGVTALSFVEIFYYFTLRLAWTLRMYRFGENEKK